LAGDTEVLGENLPQCRFVHHKLYIPDANPGRRGGKPATNRLSYGMARTEGYLKFVEKNMINCNFSCQKQNKIFLRKILQVVGRGAVIVASKPSHNFNY
jgi:hypothetical protein